MESKTSPGAVAQQTVPPTNHSYTNGDSSVMTAQPTTDGDLIAPPFDAPLPTPDIDQNDEYNDTVLADQAVLGPEPHLNSQATQMFNGLSYGEMPQDFADEQQLADNPHGFDASVPFDDTLLRNLPSAALQNGNVDPENARAYAKLTFADGDLYVTTHDVVLGRNMERFYQIKRRQKQERRAREELDTYRKEPSQPSQHGDGDQKAVVSNSSQSLEGRPAPPSNFSEQGGSVWFQPHSDNEIDMQRPKPRRRISHFSKSSSTTSVAPASLHAGMLPHDPHGEPFRRTCAFIPIHTEVPEHITKISKEHLIFSFNFDEERWELKVVGNRAFVNETLFEKGTLIPLHHNDEIIIASVSMVFKLPDNFRHSPGLSRGTFSKDSEDESLSGAESDEALRMASTSPARRLSNAIQSEDSESEQEDAAEVSTKRQGRPKLKLKNKAGKGKTKPVKLNVKAAMPKSQKPTMKDSSSEESPAAMKAPKGPGKKPKAAANAEAEKDGANGADSPTAAAPFIKPGSALEGIPLDELPEKRKGPGRPPKEGNVSKRDTQLANKKKKEYEKRGEEPPPFKELVNMVRKESKQKEWQAKMEASGQIESGQDIRPSIETEADGIGASTQVKEDGDEAAGQESAKRSSPKPRRQIRAISPVKPEAECTAEELKRPESTYIHIIDQVLREHHTGIADLQEIYELIMKKYPFYKYSAPTMGWQSSVRHNLLQAPRFKDVGKSGKGKLWTIDHDIPLEKEKRKRNTPPPKGQMVNGQYGPVQAQHAQYGNSYGQPRPPGPPHLGAGNYYSPYAQHGYPPQPKGGAPSYGYPPSQQAQWPPRPVKDDPNPFASLVAEILDFNEQQLAPYLANPVEKQRQMDKLNSITEFMSEFVAKKIPGQELLETVRNGQEFSSFATLAEKFYRYNPGIFIPDPWSAVPLEEQLRSNAAAVAESTAAQGSGEAQPAPSDSATSAPIQQPSSADVEGLAAQVSAGIPAAAGHEAADVTGGPGSKRSPEDDGEEPQAKRLRAE